MGVENIEGKFKVIADYDPSMFSQSGRPGLELELVEGDVVTVTGGLQSEHKYGYAVPCFYTSKNLRVDMSIKLMSVAYTLWNLRMKQNFKFMLSVCKMIK